MHRSIIAILLITALLGMQTNAHSEYITVSGADGTYDLHAGEFSGLLGSTDNQFSMSELDLLAATLHGNGIDTIGHLTFFLANTDAGVSLIGLFDGVAVNDPNDSISNHFLGVSATTSSDTDWFATGDTGSQTEWYDLGNGTQLVNAYLGWEHEQTSAGFAWGDVQTAQAGTVTLYDIDLTEFAGRTNPIRNLRRLALGCRRYSRFFLDESIRFFIPVRPRARSRCITRISWLHWHASTSHIKRNTSAMNYGDSVTTADVIVESSKCNTGLNICCDCFRFYSIKC